MGSGLVGILVILRLFHECPPSISPVKCPRNGLQWVLRDVVGACCCQTLSLAPCIGLWPCQGGSGSHRTICLPGHSLTFSPGTSQPHT